MSITTKSPVSAGRSTSLSEASRASSASWASVMSSSLTSTAGQLDAQRVVAGHGDDRTHLAGRLELDRTGLLAVGDLDLGCGDQVDVVLVDRARQVLGNRVAQCLLACRAEADAGLEHLAGHLAGTESGEVDLLRQQLERLVDVLVELSLFDFDVHLDLVVLEDFNRTLHGGRGYLCLVDSAAGA